MKIKVVQYFIGNDKKYIKLSKLSEKINSLYCKLYDYEFKFDYINDIDYDKNLIINTQNEYYDKLCTYKLKFIYENLNDCDYLVFIDADAAVSKPNIKIEDLINNDNDHELFISGCNIKWIQNYYLSQLYNKLVHFLITKRELLFTKYLYEFYDELNLFMEFDCLFTSPTIFNEGFIIIKNTELMKKFFLSSIELIKYFFNRIYKNLTTDGAVMGFLMQQKQYYNKWKMLPSYVQGCYASVFEFKYDEDKTFLLHNYGDSLNIDQKYFEMNKLLSNKWWKEKISELNK